METTKIVELFEELAEDFGHEDFRVRSYSGRGMYGSECLGVECSDALQTVQAVMEGLTERLDDLDQLRELCEGLGRPSVDSMGRGQILYWPSVEWPEDRGDDEDAA